MTDFESFAMFTPLRSESASVLLRRLRLIVSATPEIADSGVALEMSGASVRAQGSPDAIALLVRTFQADWSRWEGCSVGSAGPTDGAPPVGEA